MGVRAPEKVRAPACTPGFADGGRPSRRSRSVFYKRLCNVITCFFTAVRGGGAFFYFARASATVILRAGSFRFYLCKCSDARPEKVRAPACTPGFADGGRPSRRQQIRPRTSRTKLEAVRETELAKLCVCVLLTQAPTKPNTRSVCVFITAGPSTKLFVNLGQELLKL